MSFEVLGLFLILFDRALGVARFSEGLGWCLEDRLYDGLEPRTPSHVIGLVLSRKVSFALSRIGSRGGLDSYALLQEGWWTAGFDSAQACLLALVAIVKTVLFDTV